MEARVRPQRADRGCTGLQVLCLPVLFGFQRLKIFVLYFCWSAQSARYTIHQGCWTARSPVFHYRICLSRPIPITALYLLFQSGDRMFDFSSQFVLGSLLIKERIFVWKVRFGWASSSLCTLHYGEEKGAVPSQTVWLQGHYHWNEMSLVWKIPWTCVQKNPHLTGNWCEVLSADIQHLKDSRRVGTTHQIIEYFFEGTLGICSSSYLRHTLGWYQWITSL